MTTLAGLLLSASFLFLLVFALSEHLRYRSERHRADSWRKTYYATKEYNDWITREWGKSNRMINELLGVLKEHGIEMERIR